MKYSIVKITEKNYHLIDDMIFWIINEKREMILKSKLTMSK